MAKPIYAGSYNNSGGGWKKVFVVIILIQIVLVAGYLIWSKGKKNESEDVMMPEPAVPSAEFEPGIPDLMPAPIVVHR